MMAWSWGQQTQSPQEDSWFSALALGDSVLGRASEKADSIEADGEAGADALKGESTFRRLFHAFLASRATLGAALAVVQLGGAIALLRNGWLVPALCVAYATQALAIWWFIARHRRREQAARSLRQRLHAREWLLTVGVDLVAFAIFHAVDRTASDNFGALLVLPVLMAGVLTPRLIALGTASMASLLLLGAAWFRALQSNDWAALMMPAGLGGIGFFVVSLLAGELAARLAREERSAKGSMEVARQQAQLNRLVIEEMQDGVLVVDARGKVRAANPAARRLLASDGMVPPPPFTLQGQGAWVALHEAVTKAFHQNQWAEEGLEVPLQFEGEPLRLLHVRMRFTRHSQGQHREPMAVLFLEDVRTLQTRARQEKLAVMGRVSAGIAHEIRNPLAAISQANALLQEDALTPAQQQLTRMVANNVERLKHIVDDVMEAAPGHAVELQAIDARAEVEAVCNDWALSQDIRLAEQTRLQVRWPDDVVGVLFEPEHLRRVLVNLLDNAWRHASQAPGAIAVSLQALDERTALLSVASDSAPIAPEVEARLFEPFFSTRSRGTGLGLYICRELCERYGARIDYRLRSPQHLRRNEFFVALRRAPLNATAQASFLSAASSAPASVSANP